MRGPISRNCIVDIGSLRRAAASPLLLYESGPQLAGTPDILAGLSPSELSRVVQAGHKLAFAAGDVIFRQGDRHRGIFVLQAGAVRSFYVGPTGREITLANWGPGNFVGGPDIFVDGPHVWSGIATAAGAAIRVRGQAVRHLMREVPAFAVGLVEGLAFKGKCYSTLLQMLGTRSVTERLALVLVNLATSRGRSDGGRVVVAPAPTHEELAGTVGATRQWVSATLERFRAARLIEAGDRRVVILNEPALRAVAEGGGTGAP